MIPIDTVLFIQVTFKKKPELSEFQIDDKKFITFDPSEPPNIGFKAYVDDEEGIRYEGRPQYLCIAAQLHAAAADHPHSFAGSDTHPEHEYVR